MRPRLLPLTIAVTAILLASKLADLGLAMVPAAPAVVTAAQAASVPPPEQPAPKPAHPAPPLAAAPPAAPATRPILPVSDAERQLLLDLRMRRAELDGREKTLSEREGVLEAAQQKLSARVNELTVLQGRLEQLQKDRADRQEANWAGLVKVYETMKPHEAAAIFNDMDMQVLLPVLDRMKAAKAAALLAAMAPDRARLATAQLAAARARAETVPDRPSPG